MRGANRDQTRSSTVRTKHSAKTKQRTAQKKSTLTYYEQHDIPSSPERHLHAPEIRAVWSELPARVRVGFGRFRDAWIIALRYGATADAMTAGLKRYYASHQGRGKFARRPHTFIGDEGWSEPAEAWGGGEGAGTNPAGPAPKVDWTGCKPLSYYRNKERTGE